MIKYTISGRKVQVDPETFTVAAFKAIWDYDKTDKKDLASNLLTFVFTMNDERELNPFRDVSFDKKEAACKNNAFGDPNYKFNKEEEALIKAAAEWFLFLNSSSIQRLARAAEKSIDRIASFLDTHDVDSMEDVAAIMGQLKTLSAVIKGKKEMDKEAREEMDRTKLKGGGKQSLNSKRML